MVHHTSFVAGVTGRWHIQSMTSICGAGLASAPRLDRVRHDPAGAMGPSPAWALNGHTSNIRYATRLEVTALQAVQEPLDRPAARHAALIPIRKSAAWWDLAQDERRAIFEETSHHTRIGMDYLPAIARQLFHARDLGEPFDFLTWFEFKPEHTQAFDDLLGRLRSTAEWTFVEREVDIRLGHDELV